MNFNAVRAASSPSFRLSSSHWPALVKSLRKILSNGWRKQQPQAYQSEAMQQEPLCHVLSYPCARKSFSNNRAAQDVTLSALSICRTQMAAEDKQTGHVVSVINCYFMSQGGAMFRAQVESCPYLYLQIKVGVHAVAPDSAPQLHSIPSLTSARRQGDACVHSTTRCMSPDFGRRAHGPVHAVFRQPQS